MEISSSQGGKIRRGRAVRVKDRDLGNPGPAPSLRFFCVVEEKSSTSELGRQESSFSFNLQHHPPLLLRLLEAWCTYVRAHTHR